MGKVRRIVVCDSLEEMEEIHKREFLALSKGERMMRVAQYGSIFFAFNNKFYRKSSEGSFILRQKGYAAP